MITAALAVLETDRQRNELAEFYEKNKSRLYMIAFSKLHDSAAAEDAVQEAFLRISDKPERFFGLNETEKLYFAGIVVRNIAVDIFRRGCRIGDCDMEAEPFEELSLEDGVMGKIAFEDMVEFIRRLPEKKKNALILRVRYGMSTAEIARTLGISEPAARKRLSEAGKKVRKYIERYNNG
ncbi:MAG: sigma-70 family RNA polymerase sigma factor [Oscillospiraceae bacterium]|nr:sigma-70 family RNA polymerase sigma factor [Oscillospiraceae bacterium]MCH5209093.1 sigma-70 family RNA polymerase sigma factor [Oscillospiraceae bacterium]